MHACQEEIVRNRTRVRTGPTDSRNNDKSRYTKKIISHDMHQALHEILVVYCFYTLYTHGTCCMIHACSLYLYVVRFVTCQMVYLIHSWVNVFRSATSRWSCVDVLGQSKVFRCVSMKSLARPIRGQFSDRRAALLHRSLIRVGPQGVTIFANQRFLGQGY